ncbi:hypothetical protein PANT_27d00063 [Moesziomyces antarcticus T-34]|uniref:Phosphatidate phosphatase APP1 catalytic domain-containing protein n=1 Tax=Pseudozyma antarctica (strain T-34) TaxID=1151754 RepID=M9M8H0_PSEA3|nr:hypothetical protein PANT_27d00063 [Moesziomyces antarcticus T-34]
MHEDDQHQTRTTQERANMSRFRIRSRAANLLSSSADYLASRDWQAVAGSARARFQPQLAAADPTSHSRSPSAAASFSSSAPLPRFRDMSLRAGAQNVVLLPGWAQRKVARDRHPQGWATVDAPEDLEDGEIEIHVSIHGFASKVLDSPSRSQRIFNQMARQLAGLPRIQSLTPDSSVLQASQPFVDEPQEMDSSQASLPQDTDSSSHPHSSERIARKLIENADDETLVRLMENLHAFPTDHAAAKKAAQGPSHDHEPLHQNVPSIRTPSRSDTVLSGGSAQWLNRSADEVSLFHHNLSRRLHDYWVYRLPHHDVFIEISPVINGDIARDSHGNRLIMASTRLTADATGQFEHRLIIPWHMLNAFCRHYADLLQAAPHQIQALDVKATLLADSSDTASSGPESPWRRCSIHEDHPRRVRVISDIDDTVKHTGVVQGAKQILRNVFVLPYKDAEVKGISSWYHAMTDLGVGLHYVTNAPLELHNLVLDFLEAVRLPISHLVLKHYPSGARSLFSSWLEPAGERKRANVAKILDDFRTSQFILIGDSGELDLELYCALAAERPSQIRGIFIRDVSTPAARASDSSAFSASSASDAPTTSTAASAGQTLPSAPKSALTQPSPIRRTDAPEIPFFDTSYPPRAPTVLDLPTSNYTGRAAEAVRTSRALSEQEIRQAQIFQTRLNKATSMLPRTTVFRLFKEGGDVQDQACQLIRELQSGTRPADRTS